MLPIEDKFSVQPVLFFPVHIPVFIRIFTFEPPVRFKPREGLQTRRKHTNSSIPAQNEGGRLGNYISAV